MADKAAKLKLGAAAEGRDWVGGRVASRIVMQLGQWGRGGGAVLVRCPGEIGWWSCEGGRVAVVVCIATASVS